MRSYLLFFLFITFSGCFIHSSKNISDNYIFKIEDKPVLEEEFLYNLNKNTYDNDSIVQQEEIEEYLDLYINFKLKVFEARQFGYDTTSSYKNEFNKYKNQLTESFMKDDSIINELVKEAYEHLQFEINASHILIKVENFANPKDTLTAFKKIKKIYELANSGRDFYELTIEFSEDPSVKMNNGNLGYFTGLQMVYPFEIAAYRTALGQISNPFKTRFGYHILKVHDKRPTQGKVQVAHIMLRYENHSSQEDSLIIRNQIFTIYDSLNSGGDWDYFCKKYSQDENSKNNGGILQPFETGRIIPVFSETAFSLKNTGDISSPVSTPYGWHIIKLVSKIPLQSFDEMKDELTNKVKQDSRSNMSENLLIKKLKSENEYHLNEYSKRQLFVYADSSLLLAKWVYDGTESFNDSILFSINKIDYRVKDFFQFVKTTQRQNRNADPAYYMNELFNEFSNQKIIEYERDHLAEKYFDYKMLVKEYEEGILLFEIMDQKIWSKAVKDTVGLESYFHENIDKYQWGPRLKAIIYRSPDTAIINKVRELLQKPYYYVSNDSISFTFNQNKIIESEKLNQIDSLYNSILHENQKFLEYKIAQDIDSSEIISFLYQNDFKIEKFIINRHLQKINTLKVVSISKKDVDRFLSDKSGVNLHIESGIYQKGDQNIIDLVHWQQGIYDLSIEDDEYIVYVEEVLPPMDQQLDEIKGKVISDYQNFLEKKWIQELRETYDIQINNKALAKIIRQFEKY